MPKKKVHRSRRVRIYSFCFIDSVKTLAKVVQIDFIILVKCYIDTLPSPPYPKMFLLHNELKIFRTKRFLET